MAKNRKLSSFQEDDLRLWRFVTRDVESLGRQEKLAPAFAQNPAISDSPALPERQKSAPKTPRQEKTKQDFVATRPVLIGQQTNKGHLAGMDRRSSHRLQRGDFPIEAKLDLHGLGKAQARIRLCYFLRNAQEAGMRNVLIITGKGRDFPHKKGVLWENFPLWVREQEKYVVNISPARPEHGADGAFYVLLRRKRGAHGV